METDSEAHLRMRLIREAFEWAQAEARKEIERLRDLADSMKEE